MHFALTAHTWARVPTRSKVLFREMLTSSQQLLETLAPLVERTPGGLFAFDADGTLWSGDVGDDVFHEATQHGLLRDEARAALVREASAHAIDTRGSPSELAARLWEIEAEAVAAARAAHAGELILDHLAAPVPYAEAKPLALRGLAPQAELLASFGDSAFDIELLRAARIGVAVRPKPALRERLAEVRGVVVLAAERGAVASSRSGAGG